MTAAYQRDFERPGSVRSSDRVEQLYRLYFNLMLYLSSQRFRVPEGDAEALIHEVFLAFLASSSEVRDPRAWLVGSICHASRHYWRVRGRTESISNEHDRSDPTTAGIADSVATRISVRETLSRLQEKCRRTLQLHYFDGCSAIEVAKEMDTTPGYAEKLIHKCLKRAHAIYVSMTGVRK